MEGKGGRELSTAEIQQGALWGLGDQAPTLALSPSGWHRPRPGLA